VESTCRRHNAPHLPRPVSPRPCQHLPRPQTRRTSGPARQPAAQMQRWRAEAAARRRAAAARSRSMRELDASWSARIDVLVVDAARVRRIFPGAIALSFALCLAVAARKRQGLDLSVGPANWNLRGHRVEGRTVQSVLRMGRGEATRDALEELTAAENRREVIVADAEENWAGTISSTAYEKFPDIPVRAVSKPAVRRQYAQLAAAYLSPFPKEISRASYFDYLRAAVNKSSSACAGCFLVQVVDGAVYVYDPLDVRTSMAPFREVRMREALHWTAKAVQSGSLASNTEFVVSTQDSVVSTSRPHTYRMGNPDLVPRPIFTVSRCNCSDNIPFPMHYMDILRRAFPEKFWTHRNNTLDHWDDVSTDGIGSQKHESHVWGRKKSQAVFRGSIRVPAIFSTKEAYESNCNKTGRTALHARAEAHAVDVARKNAAWDRRYWAWRKLGEHSSTVRAEFAALWGGRYASVAQVRAHEKRRKSLEGLEGEPLLDVQISGWCGGREYTSDKLDMANQTNYKYSIHAEGNGMWADRLAIQLFGSSAVIKQSTACGMWFEPLLRAYQHFIPVDQHFSDIVRQVRWARRNDDRVQQIVRTAREFAGDFLTISGVEAFTEELLVQYSSRLPHRTQIKLHPKAKRVWPVA
jgi:Glycosyl transferase family 90